MFFNTQASKLPYPYGNTSEVHDAEVLGKKRETLDERICRFLSRDANSEDQWFRPHVANTHLSWPSMWDESVLPTPSHLALGSQTWPPDAPQTSLTPYVQNQFFFSPFTSIRKDKLLLLFSITSRLTQNLGDRVSNSTVLRWARD